MKITHKEIRHVAELARLRFSPSEEERITAQLNDILDYIAKLQEVDTTGIEPTSHVLELVNAFRQDEAMISLSRDESLSNAPEEASGMFTVPRII